MAEYLKKAKPQAPQDRRTLENTVRAMLDRIAAERDEAIRQYARELDKCEHSRHRRDRSVAAKLPRPSSGTSVPPTRTEFKRQLDAMGSRDRDRRNAGPQAHSGISGGLLRRVVSLMAPRS
jgi:hypothetical protein